MLEKLTEPISEEELEKSAQFLADLISIPTYEDRPDALLGAVQLCAGYLSSNKNIKIIVDEKEKPHLIAALRGEDLDKSNTDVCLVGHLDVVPGDEKQFKPTRKGNLMFGRGAFDMKGPVVSLIKAFSALYYLPEKPSVALILTTDEEDGGRQGVKIIL